MGPLGPVQEGGGDAAGQKPCPGEHRPTRALSRHEGTSSSCGGCIDRLRARSVHHESTLRCEESALHVLMCGDPSRESEIAPLEFPTSVRRRGEPSARRAVTVLAPFTDQLQSLRGWRWKARRTDGEIVLVTGGSGFLGSWCLVELLRRGYRVRTTVRELSREPEIRAMLAPEVNVGDRLSVRAADLTSDAGWDEAIEGCDYVLHVASPFPPQQPNDPDELIVPAREGTLRVLRAGLKCGVKRIVAHLFRGGGRQQRQAPRLRSADRGRLERSPSIPTSAPTAVPRRSRSGRPGTWCAKAARRLGSP